MSEIIVDDLRFSYPPLQRGGEPVPVLTGVELQVEGGEFLSIMGGTGVGKTTLCLALNGTVPQSTGGRFGGDVVVAGLNTKEHPVALLASQVGIVFQDAESQLFNMTVEDEVAFGLESLGVPRAEMRERVEWALSAVEMAPHRHRSPFHLSGGQKQRVAIAAMLAMLPRILVLDEPTSGLDPAGKAEVFRVISRLRHNQQMTIVLVEQEGEKIAEFSDRVAVLHEGQIALIGSPADVFSQVDLLHEMGVTVPQVSELANLLNRHKGTRHVFTTLDDARQALALALKIAPTGRATRQSLESAGYPRGAPPVATGSSAELHQGPVTTNKLNPQTLNRGSPCIQVRHLWYRYNGESDAVRSISLDVEEGDFVAIIGQNGSGKTTLVKHFNGLLKPTRGTVQVYGQDTADLSIGQLARQVGYVFQNPDHQIFSPTVRQEIAFGPQNLGLTGDEVDRRVAEALARFHLAAHADAPPALLGYGLRRKVGVAAVYAMRPRVFILDEPTAGLDWRGVQELMSLLSDMNAEGHTILLVTHDMRIVAKHARRTVVLHEGKVLADGNTRAVFKRTDWLTRARIEPPQIVQLARQLALSGVGMPTDVLTVEAFCDAYGAHLTGQGVLHEL